MDGVCVLSRPSIPSYKTEFMLLDVRCSEREIWIIIMIGIQKNREQDGLRQTRVASRMRNGREI